MIICGDDAAKECVDVKESFREAERVAVGRIDKVVADGDAGRRLAHDHVVAC